MAASRGQQLRVLVYIRDKWCPWGVHTGTSAIYNLHHWHTEGLSAPSAHLQVTPSWVGDMHWFFAVLPTHALPMSAIKFMCVDLPESDLLREFPSELGSEVCIRSCTASTSSCAFSLLQQIAWMCLVLLGALTSLCSGRTQQVWGCNNKHTTH